MKVIDLSQTFENNMSQFPGTPTIQLEAITSVEETGYQVTDFHSVVHVGTHCDAPAHFISGATTIDQLPLDQFVGEAVLIDVTHVQERKLPKEVLHNADIKKTILSFSILIYLINGIQKLMRKKHFIFPKN